jgi:hypothetical protein
LGKRKRGVSAPEGSYYPDKPRFRSIHIIYLHYRNFNKQILDDSYQVAEADAVGWLKI